ncbi:LuxR family transcriptional regulator [Burkholderia ubonensis]|uniref:GIY-YIG nuclease family protein n=1 Tax=Burkholderia ubonensis TaxID=101571 RepID=UPI0008FEA8F5|nr:GIY-YIG nuclease family protein [Burkholderia ubonensis]OJB47064.1 LuxR family transcriptional regulator [Burkholderia ubonensis]OJB53043.1 LuxR family transcriptional regulator [Burkholderia ubonensis]
MDRKRELKQQYKDTPRLMGVYRVVNKTTGRSLVEAGRDVNARLNRHMTQLRFGNHPNKQLQGDWNRLGAEAFGFELIEALKPLDKPDYNPDDDLEMLLAITLERSEFDKEHLYNR